MFVLTQIIIMSYFNLPYINNILQICNLGTKQLLFTREAVQGTCLSFSATGSASRKDLNYVPFMFIEKFLFFR